METPLAADSPLASFIYALDSPAARKQYPKRLRIFLTFIGMPGRTVEEQATAFLAKNDIQFYRDSIIRYITYNKQRVLNKELAAGTLGMYYHTIKLFYDMNDITEKGINWDKISRGLPKARVVANDRAPTLEEIRKLMEYGDRRMKVLVTVMFSSGIRVDTWSNLQLKHVVQVHDSGVARLTVYDDENEQYYSYITPEAHTAIKEWMTYRESYGEKITPDSYLMRDLWPTIDTNSAPGLATHPKKLATSSIQKILNRALKKQGIRQPLKKGVRRHSFKLAHGFRKAFRSKAGTVMHHLNVELIIGHKMTGTQETYWKPTEQELVEDYLRAVDYLTIGKDQKTATLLQKQVAELAEKNEEANQVINIKLAEKDKQIELLTEEYDRMNEMVLRTARTMDSMIEMFKDAGEKKKGQEVSNQKYTQLVSDTLSMMEVSSGLSKQDFAEIWSEALKGDRKGMEKKLMQARQAKRVTRDSDKIMLIVMENFAEDLRRAEEEKEEEKNKNSFSTF